MRPFVATPSGQIGHGCIWPHWVQGTTSMNNIVANNDGSTLDGQVLIWYEQLLQTMMDQHLMDES
jgi:hypothetical protein